MIKEIFVNGDEVGYVICRIEVDQERTLCISQFMIMPEFRRKGYFKLLFAEAKKTARHYKCATMTLSVGSQDDTEDFLFSLYERYGFRRTIGNNMQITI